MPACLSCWLAGYTVRAKHTHRNSCHPLDTRECTVHNGARSVRVREGGARSTTLNGEAALKAKAAQGRRDLRLPRAHVPDPSQGQRRHEVKVMLDAVSAWTEADVKAALRAKTGHSRDCYYLVAGGGKRLNGAVATLAALSVGPGGRLELRGRLRGGMPSQDAIRAAFALYDTNGDGHLSPEELKAITCRPVPGGTPRTEEEVDDLVRQFDTDGDGMCSRWRRLRRRGRSCASSSRRPHLIKVRAQRTHNAHVSACPATPRSHWSTLLTRVSTT